MRLAVVFILSPIAFGQFSVHSQPSDDGTGLSVTLQGYYCSQQEPVGAPFSAKKFTEYNRLEADGGRKVGQEDVQMLWRDSQWRVRTDFQLRNSQLVLGEICDPVGGFLLLLDSQNKIAHRVAFPPPTPQVIRKAAIREVTPVTPQRVRVGGQVQAAGPNYRAPEQLRRIRESLGTKIVEGVYVEGEGSSDINPEGVRVMEQENWRSPYLRMDVLSKLVLRSNTTTSRLINISLGEPDPLVFALPADYSIVDEKESFSIVLKNR